MRVKSIAPSPMHSLVAFAEKESKGLCREGKHREYRAGFESSTAEQFETGDGWFQGSD